MYALTNRFVRTYRHFNILRPTNRIWIVLLSIQIMTFACSNKLTRNPVPLSQISKAEVVDMPGIRSWIDEYSPEFQEDIENSVREECEGYFPVDTDGTISYSALALSGGGSNGAFGAGILNGWTAAGTRPSFKLVTGISAGSLLAPFAFLGPDYDDELREVFTSITTEDIATKRGVSALWNESFADTAPLAGLIERYIDENALKAIAEAHNCGQRLYIGTTNLDAQRLTVWNMGAIANSGHPKALDLFRKIMLASSTMPAIFPPVFIEVEVDGSQYDEMHVDGGLNTQVFFHGLIIDIADAKKKLLAEKDLLEKKGIVELKPGNVYIIRNGKISPSPKHIERKIPDIIGQTLSTMIKSSARHDLIRIYMVSQRDDIDFNYIGIPDDFESTATEAFDQEEMNRLFLLGYDMGNSGVEWVTTLPGDETEE